MLCIENVSDKISKTPFPKEIAIAKRIYHHCKDRGLIVRPIGSLIVISPPLTYDQEAIDQTVLILEESIIATMNDLIKERLWK